MFKNLKHLKNQRGLTLIELLVVVVILGIIAAIAIPSVGGLMDNAKKDAHVANATQMISAAKLAITSEKALSDAASNATESTPYQVSLRYLVEEGYIESPEDPDGSTEAADTAPRGYLWGNGVGTNVGGSFVQVYRDNNNQLQYSVKLVNNGGTSARGVQTGADAEGNGAGNPVKDSALDRTQVNP